MFRNYLVATIRNLFRNKTITAINLAGFTLGLIFTVYIFHLVKNELTYDTYFHENKKVFRLVSVFKGNRYDAAAFPIKESLKTQFPQVDLVTPFAEKELLIKTKNSEFKQPVQFVEKDFFKIFQFSPIRGSYSKFDKDISSAIITKSTASFLFGENNPIGNTISVEIGDKLVDYRIDGIIEDAPANSSINLTVILPFVNYSDKIVQMFNNDWLINQFSSSCFIKLNNVNNKSVVENKLSDILKPNVETQYHNIYKFFLQPISEMHFDKEAAYSRVKTSDKNNVYILSALALFIMIIISFNYINLTIAKSFQRLKEIGIRKTIGALRNNIISQFVIESSITVFISFSLSMLLLPLFLPIFNSLLNERIKIDFGANLSSFIWLIFLLSLSVIIGVFPAIKTSKHRPQIILQGNQPKDNSKLISRIFISLQFAISIFLLFGAIILNLQFNFIKSKDTGFKKDRMVMIKASEMFGRYIDAISLNSFKNEVMASPLISSVTGTQMAIGGEGIESMCRFDYNNKFIASSIFYVDTSALPTLKFKLIKGRNFSENEASNALIVNETFLKELNIKEPLTSEVTFRFIKAKQMNIIGVVKDFNYFSLRDSISPAAFFFAKIEKTFCTYIYAGLKGKDIDKSLSFLRNKWEKFFPNQGFYYQFLDERIDELYKNERKWKNLITYASATAIFFACLGLFGLILFTTERRTKEIGIRKVLGASVFEVVKLLVKEYFLLLIISLVIALPPAFYFSGKWLQNFAYRIDPGFLVFALTVTIIFFVTISTVCFQAIKAATANLVESLRHE